MRKGSRWGKGETEERNKPKWGNDCCLVIWKEFSIGIERQGYRYQNTGPIGHKMDVSGSFREEENRGVETKGMQEVGKL